MGEVGAGLAAELFDEGVQPWVFGAVDFRPEVAFLGRPAEERLDQEDEAEAEKHRQRRLEHDRREDHAQAAEQDGAEEEGGVQPEEGDKAEEDEDDAGLVGLAGFGEVLGDVAGAGRVVG